MDRGDETPGPTLELALHTLTCDSESKSCFPFCFRPLLFVPSHLEFSLLSPLLARRQPDPLLHSPGTPGAAHTHSHCCLNANVARASSWHPLWKDKAESVCPQTSQECAEKIICGAWVETLHSSWARSCVLPLVILAGSPRPQPGHIWLCEEELPFLLDRVGRCCCPASRRPALSFCQHLSR